MGSRVCSVLCPLDRGYQTPYTTQDQDFGEVWVELIWMGSLGGPGPLSISQQNIEQTLLCGPRLSAGSTVCILTDASQIERQCKRDEREKRKGSKAKQKDQASPFQAETKSFTPWAMMDASPFMPSTTLSPNPFAATSSALIAQDQAWVEALRKAYPDPAQMPEETKILVEQAEKTHGRKGIKNLHQATTHLGKVKDHLGEVSEHRRAHRALWMKHMSAGIQIWEQQLEEYRKHQAFLTEQATKARSEITATSRIIQQLSHTAGGAAVPSTPVVQPVEEDPPEDAVDKEEEKHADPAASSSQELRRIPWPRHRAAESGGNRGWRSCCGGRQTSQKTKIARALCWGAYIMNFGRALGVECNPWHMRPTEVSSQMSALMPSGPRLQRLMQHVLA